MGHAREQDPCMGHACDLRLARRAADEQHPVLDHPGAEDVLLCQYLQHG